MPSDKGGAIRMEDGKTAATLLDAYLDQWLDTQLSNDLPPLVVPRAS